MGIVARAQTSRANRRQLAAMATVDLVGSGAFGTFGICNASPTWIVVAIVLFFRGCLLMFEVSRG